MNEGGQESLMDATVESVAAPHEMLSPDPFLSWGWRTWVVAIPLVLIVLYAFMPILKNGFMPSFDDNQNFLENPYFRGFGTAQLRWAWTTLWVGAYQPFAWMLFGSQYVFFQLDPWGYHLTSLLFQTVNAVVLYYLTLTLLVRCRSECHSESPWLCVISAGLATALFAVHPLRVEVVAWASNQPYLPCGLFSMLSVLAYLCAFPLSSRPRRVWLVGSFIMFVAALLFKAVPIGLPAVLLILDVYPLHRFRDENGRWSAASAWRTLWEKVPFLLVSLVFIGLAIAAKPQSRIPFRYYDATEGIARACYGAWFYILNTVLPLDLIAFYQVPMDLNWLKPPFVLAILAMAAISAGLFLLRRRWPGLLAAWLCYLVILAPNSGIIWTSNQIAADRYSYMSMLGSVTLTAEGFCRLRRISSRWRPGAIGITALGLSSLLALTALTRNQCRTWRDTETLWDHALAHGASSSYLAHSLFGDFLYRQGKYNEAQAQFAEALRLGPGLAEAHYNLGNVLYAQGRFEKAMAHFIEAIRFDPDFPDAHYNLGVALQTKGMNQVAQAHYAEAVRLRPGYADAHKNLGFVLYSQGKYEAAAEHFAEALRLNPRYPDVHNSLGMILSHQKKYSEAAAHFNEALRLHPGNVQAHDNLGLVFFRIGKYEAAQAQFAEALRLDPGDANAYNANALLMAACPEAKFRDAKGAVQFATRACELTQWKNPIILDTLAAAQAEAGDFDAAVAAQKRALELLTVERQKDQYRNRLELYQAKKPYRQETPPQASIGPLP